MRHFLDEVLANVQYLGVWSYVLLALLVAVEGPIATLLGAATASSGLLNPIWVFVAAALGNLTGDGLWYSLGHIGQTEWLLKHGRWLGLTPDNLEAMKRKMRKEAPGIIFIAKITLFFAVPALVAAGVSHVPWRRWFPIDAVGEVLWTGTLVMVGYFLSRYIGRLGHDVQIIAGIGSAVSVFAVLAGIKYVGARWGRRSSGQ